MRAALVVDDSAVVRKVTRHLLEMQDFKVLEAEDGESALDLCREAMPELILVDASIPKTDCHTLLRALREVPGGERARIVFCTIENDVGAIARALHEGADTYLMKPFDHDMLLAKLEQVGFQDIAAA